MPHEKFERFKKEYELSDYDSEILTRDRVLADYFEETAKFGKTQSVSAKQIANAIINKKINTQNTNPQDLIKNIKESGKTDQVDDTILQSIIEKVIKEKPKAVADYKRGKVQVIGFLIGKVKQHFPKGDTNQIKTAIEKSLR